MAKIGPNVIRYMTNLVRHMLESHQEDIDDAFLAAEKGIKFPIPITIKPGKKTPLTVKVGFGPLTMGKIRDEIEADLDENQMIFFDHPGDMQVETPPDHPETEEDDDARIE